MFYCPACGARSECAYPNLMKSHPPECSYLCHACHLLSQENSPTESIFTYVGAIDPNSYAQIRKAYPTDEDETPNFEWMKIHVSVVNQWLMAHGSPPMNNAFTSYLEGQLYLAYTRALTEYDTLLRDVVTAWRTNLPSGVFDSSNMDRLVVRICRRVGIKS